MPQSSCWPVEVVPTARAHGGASRRAAVAIRRRRVRGQQHQQQRFLAVQAVLRLIEDDRDVGSKTSSLTSRRDGRAGSDEQGAGRRDISSFH